jgi:hypothetical protein
MNITHDPQSDWTEDAHNHSIELNKLRLRAAVQAVTEEFGQDFAEKNPQLVGALVNASATEFFTRGLCYFMRDLVSQMDDISSKMKS